MGIFTTTSACDRCVRWPEDPLGTFYKPPDTCEKDRDGHSCLETGYWSLKEKKCYLYLNGSMDESWSKMPGFGTGDTPGPDRHLYVNIGDSKDGATGRELNGKTALSRFAPDGTPYYFDENGKNNKEHCDPRVRLTAFSYLLIAILLVAIGFGIYKFVTK